MVPPTPLSFLGAPGSSAVVIVGHATPVTTATMIAPGNLWRCMSCSFNPGGRTTPLSSRGRIGKLRTPRDEYCGPDQLQRRVRRAFSQASPSSISDSSRTKQSQSPSTYSWKGGFQNKRRGRDSNPWRGCKPPHRFSKPNHGLRKHFGGFLLRYTHLLVASPVAPDAANGAPSSSILT